MISCLLPHVQVADQFSKRFYEVLNKHPKFINRFYKDESEFSLQVFAPYGGHQAPYAMFTAKGPTVSIVLLPNHRYHIESANHFSCMMRRRISKPG